MYKRWSVTQNVEIHLFLKCFHAALYIALKTHVPLPRFSETFSMWCRGIFGIKWHRFHYCCNLWWVQPLYGINTLDYEAMFSPNPWGSGKVWMMLTSEYTLIIIYYVKQTWVNREGFWWGFQQGKIQPMSICMLWAVDEKPCPQLQNGPYLRFLRGHTRHILIWPSNTF